MDATSEITDIRHAPERTPKIDSFETHPDRYAHWSLTIDGDVARLVLDVAEDRGLLPGYELKLNSYDIGVDLELADAVRRLRWEHPEVKAVVVTSGKDRIFCAGANIFMLGTSSHSFKVNFCKFTNETRLYIEDASACSGQRYIAACNGVASGGGYELALACDEILLVDDRSSAVSLPEVPLLGVLPGTGGLTRVVDKRMVRRDLADHFSSLAEGVRGKRAVKWGLIDATYKLSQFEGKVAERARAHADAERDETIPPRPEKGLELTPLTVEAGPDGRSYPFVDLKLDHDARVAHITVKAPEQAGPTDLEGIYAAGMSWWPIAAFRQLDDALLHLRFNHREMGTVILRAEGDGAQVLAIDALLDAHKGDWLVHETRHLIKRVLKRIDATSRTFFALIDEGSAFYGTLFELALAADRSFMLDDPDEQVSVQLSALNGGAFPMGNGLSRLQTRFLGEPEAVGRALETAEGPLTTADAFDLGLVTFNPDDIDWEDEVRVAIEERVAMSPDALTGMEANLRFAGPETLETKIFGRLSAWQNWIFQRPNAVGPDGALKSFGQPTSARFDWERT
ncbi:MAG: 2,3-epoxybenzoyl-CoA dihydrolase [Bradymonadia bacterium]